MKKCCENFVVESPADWGLVHHVRCPKYKTEKIPRLFYREEAINGSPWVPAPDEVDAIISVTDSLSDGETVEIEFKRFDMTDEEMANLPED